MTDQTQITITLTEQDIDRIRAAMTTRNLYFLDMRANALSDDGRKVLDDEINANADIVTRIRKAAIASTQEDRS